MQRDDVEGGLHGEGEENGATWTIKQVAEHQFRITVRSSANEQSVDYHTLHPTIWGLDVYDKGQIEAILDRCIREIQDAGGS